MIKLDQGSGQILAMGEPMLELSAIDVAAGQAGFGFAGDTLNTAVYLARAFAGGTTRVGYLTVLGSDPLSAEMIAWMAREGIETGAIRRHPTRLPGLYAIEVDDSGERSFHYWRDQSAARTLFESGMPDLAALDIAQVLYLSGITLAILADEARTGLVNACAAAKAQGRTVVFDSNYRPRLWRDADDARAAFDRMWAVTSLGLPSADDEAQLYLGETPDQTLERIAAHGVEEIVLKRGASGPVLWSDGRSHAVDVSPAARVVDTTAAGDSFNAGYLHARLTGEAPPQAVHAGHRLACRVLAHSGAILPAGR